MKILLDNYYARVYALLIMKQKPLRFVQIAVERPTYHRLKQTAKQDGFTMYGLVRESLKIYEEWKAQTENWVASLDKK